MNSSSSSSSDTFATYISTDDEVKSSSGKSIATICSRQEEETSRYREKIARLDTSNEIKHSKNREKNARQKLRMLGEKTRRTDKKANNILLASLDLNDDPEEKSFATSDDKSLGTKYRAIQADLRNESNVILRAKKKARKANLLENIRDKKNELYINNAATTEAASEPDNKTTTDISKSALMHLIKMHSKEIEVTKPDNKTTTDISKSTRMHLIQMHSKEVEVTQPDSREEENSSSKTTEVHLKKVTRSTENRKSAVPMGIKKTRSPNSRNIKMARSRSPIERKRSRTPIERTRSRTPIERTRSRTPIVRKRSRTPIERTRSRTPIERTGSRTPNSRNKQPTSSRFEKKRSFREQGGGSDHKLDDTLRQKKTRANHFRREKKKKKPGESVHDQETDEKLRGDSDSDYSKRMTLEDSVIYTQSDTADGDRRIRKSFFPSRRCGIYCAIILVVLLVLSVQLFDLVPFVPHVVNNGTNADTDYGTLPPFLHPNPNHKKDKNNSTVVLRERSENYVSRNNSHCFNNNELATEVTSWMTNRNQDHSILHHNNVPMDSWCTSRVSDLTGTFSIKRHQAATHVRFNEQIGNWDVGRVTSFAKLFLGCSSFDQDVSAWDTSNVQLFTETFYFAQSFSADLSRWDTSNARDMSRTFYRALSFDADLSGWTVDNVSSTTGMFWIATSFNGDVSSWNCENITDMSYMFMMATGFNVALSSWTVDKVTDMSRMFYGSTHFNSDISTWRVDHVNNMDEMFKGASSFNSNIGTWSTTNVLQMEEMFSDATHFNHNLSLWDINKVVIMDNMFKNADKFNQQLCWSLNGAVSTSDMFSGSYGAITDRSNCF